ncbi:MAG: acyl carrier protein [Legionella sp.]|nr:acyl carrier protein [Legionella sp.]
MNTLKKRDYYNDFCHHILCIVSNALEQETRNIHLETPISQFGLDSITITKIIVIFNKVFELELSPVALYGYKTIKEMGVDLYNRYQEKIDTKSVTSHSIKLLCDQLLVENPIAPEEIDSIEVVKREYLFVFSAINRTQLLEDLHEMVLYIKGHIDKNLMATLELELMSNCKTEKIHLAIIAQDSANLLNAINSFISGELNSRIYFGEKVDQEQHNITMFSVCNDAKSFLRTCYSIGDIEKIAALWSLGIDIDWKLLTSPSKLWMADSMDNCNTQHLV